MENKWLWLNNGIRRGMGLIPIVISLGAAGCESKDANINDTSIEGTVDTGETNIDTGDTLTDECGSYPELTSEDADNFSPGTYTVCGPLPPSGNCPPVVELDGNAFATRQFGRAVVGGK